MKILMNVEDVSVTMAQASQLKQRLSAILDGKHARRPVTRWTVAALFVTTGAVLPLLASAQNSGTSARNAQKAQSAVYESLNYGFDVQENGFDIKEAAKATNLKILRQGFGADGVPISRWTELSSAQFLVATLLYNDPSTLQLALDKGVDVNARMEHGITALHVAVIFRRADMVNVLLRNGADINAQAAGKTPLDYMAVPPHRFAQTGQDQQILQMLKQAQAAGGSRRAAPPKAHSKVIDEGRVSPRDAVSASNLKQIALGAFMLETKQGALKITPQDFEAQLFPYLHTTELFRCPSIPSGEGYSFNGNLTNLKLSDLLYPHKTVMFYESRNGELDFRHDETATIAFADGSVGAVTREQAKTLRWKP